MVRVGATYDADIGGREYYRRNGSILCSDPFSAPDRVVCFSNAIPQLSLLAPGMLIDVGGLRKGGTSMAAPHVAGAVAALKAWYGSVEPWIERPGCTVARLRITGDPVVDHRTGLLFPRLNVDAAARTKPNLTGDCNVDGVTHLAEIELGVAIALGEAELRRCFLFDTDRNGAVTIDELVAAVNLNLFGCPVGTLSHV